MRSIALLTLVALTCAAVMAEDDKPAAEEGFTALFDGKTLKGWTGDVKGYVVEDGAIVCKGGNLFSEKQYSDFVLRLEFKVPPGGNNGVALRAPLEGNPAFAGIEIQVLDDLSDKYAGKLQTYQYCGSVYGVVPAKTGHTKPAGEWNTQEITFKGNHIVIKLNGETIVDADLAVASRDGTLDKQDHSGLKRKEGHVGFCGHGDPVAFRNIRIKELK